MAQKEEKATAQEPQEYKKPVTEEKPKPKDFSKIEIKKPAEKNQIKAKVREVVNLNEIGTTSEEKDEEDVLNFEDQAFTLEDFTNAIFSYSEMLEKENKPGESKLLKKENIIEDKILTILIESPVEKARFNDIKSDFLQHLRKTLKNKQVQLKSKVIEIAREKKIYTPREKFEYLSGKNPALIELKNRLGLEFEF